MKYESTDLTPEQSLPHHRDTLHALMTAENSLNDINNTLKKTSTLIVDDTPENTEKMNRIGRIRFELKLAIRLFLRIIRALNILEFSSVIILDNKALDAQIPLQSVETAQSPTFKFRPVTYFLPLPQYKILCELSGAVWKICSEWKEGTQAVSLQAIQRISFMLKRFYDFYLNEIVEKCEFYNTRQLSLKVGSKGKEILQDEIICDSSWIHPQPITRRQIDAGRKRSARMVPKAVSRAASLAVNLTAYGLQGSSPTAKWKAAEKRAMGEIESRRKKEAESLVLDQCRSMGLDPRTLTDGARASLEVCAKIIKENNLKSVGEVVQTETLELTEEEKMDILKLSISESIEEIWQNDFENILKQLADPLVEMVRNGQMTRRSDIRFELKRRSESI